MRTASTSPLNFEVGGALAKFFFAGAGPSHAKLTAIFIRAGYGDEAPYDASTRHPNKELRVRSVCRAAVNRPDGAQRLVEGIIEELRLSGAFDGSGSVDSGEPVIHLRRALGTIGWRLDDAGYLRPVEALDLTTGGRAALNEQLRRIRSSTDDPGVLLGSAKDLLEATAKFVLVELDIDLGKSPSFGQVQYVARDRLRLNPQDVNKDVPGGEHIRKVLQNAVPTAEAVNSLRALQGVGHGRVLPTGVTPELALLVVREACSISELMLTTLDRMFGNR